VVDKIRPEVLQSATKIANDPTGERRVRPTRAGCTLREPEGFGVIRGAIEAPNRTTTMLGATTKVLI
jgi:hypothetical protein